jgi:hypothetical protein
MFVDRTQIPLSDINDILKTRFFSNPKSRYFTRIIPGAADVVLALSFNLSVDEIFVANNDNRWTLEGTEELYKLNISPPDPTFEVFENHFGRWRMNLSEIGK